MLPYRLSERAVRDLDGMRSWYDEQGVLLGDRAIAAVDDVFVNIRERPGSFPELHGGVRTARCRRFPYRVYFVVTGEGVNVLAVYHTSREPNRWNDSNRE